MPLQDEHQTPMAESESDLDEVSSDNNGSSSGPRNISPAQVVKLVVGALGVVVVLELLRRAVLKGVSGGLSLRQWWHFHP